MSAIAIGQAMYLRSLAAGLKSEVERMERQMGHRELMLEKNDDEAHVIDAYARSIDNIADKVMVKAIRIKETLLEMAG